VGFSASNTGGLREVEGGFSKVDACWVGLDEA